jgi:hypothetical protein
VAKDAVRNVQPLARDAGKEKAYDPFYLPFFAPRRLRLLPRPKASTSEKGL